MSGRPLPPGPKGHWLLGHAFLFRDDTLGLLTRLARDHGDFVPVRLGLRPLVLVNCPASIEQILVDQSRQFVKHFGLQLTRNMLGNGLLNSEGDFWLRQRRLAQPAFHRDRIHAYGSVMVEHARHMLDGWRDGDERDLLAEMMDLTMRIAAKTLFGSDDPGDADRIRHAMTESVDSFNRSFAGSVWLPTWFPTYQHFRMIRVVRALDDVIYRFINERRAGGGEGRDDLLSMLLKARDTEGDGRGMTDRQLRDELMTLFLAGQETTALALSWTWYLLGYHADVEAELHAELQSVLHGREPTPDDYPKLKYAEAVIHESMRLFPPAFTLGREAIRDLEVGGYRVPKGHTLFMSQWVTHRDPRYWPEPERFRPGRWLDGSTAKLPKFAYFPFGGGPRVCIGNSFAMMEAVLVLAAVAQRFRYTPLWTEPIPPLPSITLRPTKPVTVRLHRR